MEKVNEPHIVAGLMLAHDYIGDGVGLSFGHLFVEHKQKQ